MHTIKVKEKYFSLIKNKEKIYEVRLLDDKRKQIKIGDIIKIFKEPLMQEYLEARVEDLLFFKSFNQMANSLPAKQIGFNGQGVQEIVNEYYKFYTTQDEQKFGIVAIKLKF